MPVLHRQDLVYRLQGRSPSSTLSQRASANRSASVDGNLCEAPKAIEHRYKAGAHPGASSVYARADEDTRIPASGRVPWFGRRRVSRRRRRWSLPATGGRRRWISTGWLQPSAIEQRPAIVAIHRVTRCSPGFSRCGNSGSGQRRSLRECVSVTPFTPVGEPCSCDTLAGVTGCRRVKASRRSTIADLRRNSTK